MNYAGQMRRAAVRPRYRHVAAAGYRTAAHSWWLFKLENLPTVRASGRPGWIRSMSLASRQNARDAAAGIGR